jgi:Multicopper oxidase
MTNGFFICEHATACYQSQQPFETESNLSSLARLTPALHLLYEWRRGYHTVPHSTWRIIHLPVHCETAGTHWYHSHHATMRLDGLFGLLIVHDMPPAIPYFTIAVNDWMHVTSEQLELTIDDLCENGAISPATTAANSSTLDCTFEGAQMNPTLYQSSLFGGRNRW